MPRLPVLPTLIVATAVAVMIGLGVWQLQRAEWKEGLIAELEATADQATIVCAVDAQPEVRAGRSRAGGEVGYRYLVPCGSATLDIGWSKRPDALARLDTTRSFSGAKVPSESGARAILVLEEPIPPLEASAVPQPADIPNNHLFYAIQWFFFAAAAVVIYVLALRRRRPR